MSDKSNESNSPLVSLVGNAFLITVPIALIVMLGIVGVAFMGGGGVKATAEAEASAPAAPPTAPASVDEPAEAIVAATVDVPEGAQAAAVEASGGEGIDPAVMALGKASYATCAACHGPDGAGIKAGPALMAPSLHGSEILLGDPDAALLIILKGIAKENMDYMGMMAALGAGLDDAKLASVLTYTRNSWGNSAPEITVEQAAEARAKFADVNAPAGVKRAEIQAIVDAHK